MDVGRDDRSPGGHRLEQHDPERFTPGGRRDVDVRGPEELRLLVVRDTAEELDAAQAPGGDVPACLALLRPAADEEQPALAAGLAQDAVRLEQVEHALARLEPADEQDVARAVLPAGDRHRPPEPIHVDTVGNDLVVAREEPVDEVAGRGRHGDAAVEALRVGAEDPAAELVGGRPAAVRMEGRDVDAPRLAQQHEREERHERLVEVQDVEPLAVERVPDLGDEPGREGDRPHRAVGRHREALAEPDHVAIGRPLEAVRRGEDPDVVAAQPEVLVQVPDVLRDAAGERVDVRGDEADLHRGASGSGW